MTDSLAIALFLLAALAGLAAIPLGLPGLWIMVGGLLLYGWLTAFRTIGAVTLGIALGLAIIGEILETWIGFRFATRYGGSARSGWGALIGGIAGAIVGVPIPVVGSLVGAFVGSFAGAALFEYSSSRRAGPAIGAGWGAVLGRAAAAAIKVAFGLVILVLGVVAMRRG
ncbi:MAG: DUF456 family protein [Gemmatimonadales bacterium]